MENPSLNPNLRDFWTRFARNRVLFGGRASSKSWDAAGVAIAIAQWKRTRFMATRQFQNKIDDSVYSLLKIQIERFGLLKRFAIYNNRIECPETGSDFLFYGRARNIDEIKGTEGVDVHWGEECHLMTQAEWRIIEPTLRAEGSEHWLIFNPRFATDFVYQKFVVSPPPDTIVRKINYDENPFLSQTALKVINDLKKSDYDEYEHVYLGVPFENDDAVIIRRSWIMAAIDAYKKLGIEVAGRKRIGFDIADSGMDKCASIYAHGFHVSWADQWKASEDELLKSCTRTYHAAREREASITYDSIGVGASAGAKFNDLNSTLGFRIEHSKFNAGGAVFRPDAIYAGTTKNKDQFSNIKAQAWWLLADRFRNTYNAVMHGHQFGPDEIVSISSDLPYLEQLVTELSTPMRDYDANGRVKVESKKDLDKRDISSPNLADAFVMAFAPGIQPGKINHQLLALAGRR